MQNNQPLQGKTETKGSGSYRVPLDVRHLFGQAKLAQSPRLHRLTLQEYANVRNLCLTVTLLQLLLAGIGSLQGWFPHGFLLPALFSALIVALVTLLTHRLLIPRSRLALWVAVLMIICGGQAVLWAEHLLLANGQNQWIAVSGSGLAIVLLLLPLTHSLIWLALGIVSVGLTVLLPVAASERIWLLMLMLMPVLVFGVFVRLVLAKKAAAERGRERTLRELALIRAETADQEERIQYEQEQRKRLERDFLALREVANGAGRAKTEFLATISHEIRTPLNGILPILEILQQSELNEEQQRYVSTAFSSSRHLLRIINDILDFARAESGKLAFESIEFDLPEMVEGVVELMRSSASNKGLKVMAHVAKDVPRVLRGDPVRVRQILTNLLSNAVKFADAGHIKIMVSLHRFSRKEVELMVVVSDTGPGMSRDTARKVFDSFTQGDASTTRKHGGTGLGLVICKRLVELMGGRIGVRSRLGKGSEFWFVLPMRRSTSEVPSERRNLEGVRVLWVIDDEQTAVQIRGHLKDWGVKAERAKLGEVIVRLHNSAMLGRTWAYELLLVDSWGVELELARVLGELRSDPLLRDLPVVASSRSEEIADRLHRDFGVYALSGGMRPETLRRSLYRLFDVGAESGGAAEQDRRAAFRDLNLEQELSLQEFDPDILVSSTKADTHGCVLLVEDNPVNLGVVRRVLDRLGVSTIVAQNGREALEQLGAQQAIDLVLMDCQMPLMDGYQATREWRLIEDRDARKRLPVVAMTANAMQGDREKCLDAGMDDYLPKPVSIADLQQMLDKWMPRRVDVAEEQGKASFAPELGSAETVVDEQVISELREVMGEEFQGLIATYLDNTPALIFQIREAMDAGDIESLILPAHSLKSSSANIGAMQMSELARKLEMAGRGEDLQAIEQGQPRLAPLFEETRDALQPYLQENQSSA